MLGSMAVLCFGNDNTYYMPMTTKAIKKALKDGHVVSLKGDATSMLYFDIFGDLVVVSRLAGVPTRKATRADTRQAVVHK